MSGGERNRRILFLAPFAPSPDGAHGGARAIGQLIEQMAERHQVAVLYTHAEGEPELDPRLRERLALAEAVKRPDRHSGRLRRASGVGHSARGLLATRPAWASDWLVPAFARRAGELVRAWRPHVVQAEFHVMGQYLSELRNLGAALVLVEHEPGTAAAADLAGWESGPRRLARQVDGMAWRRYERRVLGSADAVVALTDEDRGSLLELAPAVRIVTIPLGVPIPDQPLDPLGEDPLRILFIGNFIHPPNTRAALDLAGHVFPRVRAHSPRATLELVGDNPPRALRTMKRAGVVITGRVPDPRPYLNRAALVVAPARLGGGMRVKVLETLANGKALVATSRALAGVDLVPGEHALVAETDAELADAIVALLADPARRGRMASAGREWAMVHLRWTDVVASYESLHGSLLPPSGLADRGTILHRGTA